MYPEFAKPGIFPVGRLHHLVVAACAKSDPHTAWQAYAEALGDDFPNEGELRLFPLIAERLGGDLEAQPLAKYLHSTRRWARMQAMVNRQLSGQVGALFAAKNIPLMWTKGTAIVARTDGRPELRPSADLDGLIQWASVEKILEMAADEGWVPKIGLLENRRRARYDNTEISFEVGARGELDLQWLPRLPFAFDRKIQPWLWQDPNRVKDSNGIFYASDTWLLIETIEHGLNTNAVHPIRWVVDAVRLLEWRHAEIDWQAFDEIVKRNKLHYSFLAGLRTVAQYSPHIPESALKSLENTRVSHLDREEFRARVSAQDITSGYRALWALTRLRRAPAKIYYRVPPSPLNRKMHVSARVRAMIAARNVVTRLLFPIWYLVK